MVLFKASFGTEEVKIYHSVETKQKCGSERFGTKSHFSKWGFVLVLTLFWNKGN